MEGMEGVGTQLIFIFLSDAFLFVILAFFLKEKLCKLFDLPECFLIKSISPIIGLMTPFLISFHVLSTPGCCCWYILPLTAPIKQKNIQEEKSKSIFLGSLGCLCLHTVGTERQKASEKFCEKFHPRLLSALRWKTLWKLVVFGQQRHFLPSRAV